MKSRFLVSAALLALVAASPAFADRNDKDDASGDNRPHPSRDAGPSRGDQRDQGGAPAQNAAPAQNVAPGGGMRGEHRDRTDNGAMNPANGSTRRDTNTMMRPGRHGTATTNTGAPRTGAIGTGPHVHNRAFDNMRRVYTAPRRFQLGVYHRPSGWYYHRWRFGEFLPAFFFTRSYWILDWEDFALDDPPPGTVWVRYGDDAVLIDEYSGEVIQVVYGIFY